MLPAIPLQTARWLTATRALHKSIGRSKHTVPIPLAGPLTAYLLPERRGILKRWESQAGEAISARQAAVRETLAKVRYTNLLNL